MNEFYSPPTETVIFVVLFFLLYLGFLIKKTSKNSIDLFDLFLLSSLGVLPTAVVLFPKISGEISKMIGVGMPLVLLFGCLFVVVFVYLAHLASRSHKLRRTQTRLTQEVSLLKEELKSLKR